MKTLMLVLVLVAQQRQINDPREYDAYANGCYAEKDVAKQAANCEKFLADYPKSVMLGDAYLQAVVSYYHAGNWAKVIATLDKKPAGVAEFPPDQKTQLFQSGLRSAQQLNNTAKVRGYAEDFLALDPLNLEALFALSTVLYSAPVPVDPAAQSKHFDYTLDITKRALARPRPSDVKDDQWNPIVNELHDRAAMVFVNQKKYVEAIAEADLSIGINKKDGYAYYLKGLAKKQSVFDALREYNDSVQKVNDARTAGQLTHDDLLATMNGLAAAATEKTNDLVETFAKAVACGEKRALEELKIYTGTPDALDKLIQAKKAELGG